MKVQNKQASDEHFARGAGKGRCPLSGEHKTSNGEFDIKVVPIDRNSNTTSKQIAAVEEFNHDDAMATRGLAATAVESVPKGRKRRKNMPTGATKLARVGTVHLERRAATRALTRSRYRFLEDYGIKIGSNTVKIDSAWVSDVTVQKRAEDSLAGKPHEAANALGKLCALASALGVRAKHNVGGTPVPTAVPTPTAAIPSTNEWYIGIGSHWVEINRGSFPQFNKHAIRLNIAQKPVTRHVQWCAPRQVKMSDQTGEELVKDFGDAKAMDAKSVGQLLSTYLQHSWGRQAEMLAPSFFGRTNCMYHDMCSMYFILWYNFITSLHNQEIKGKYTFAAADCHSYLELIYTMCPQTEVSKNIVKAIDASQNGCIVFTEGNELTEMQVMALAWMLKLGHSTLQPPTGATEYLPYDLKFQAWPKIYYIKKTTGPTNPNAPAPTYPATLEMTNPNFIKSLAVRLAKVRGEVKDCYRALIMAIDVTHGQTLAFTASGATTTHYPHVDALFGLDGIEIVGPLSRAWFHFLKEDIPEQKGADLDELQALMGNRDPDIIAAMGLLASMRSLAATSLLNEFQFRGRHADWMLDAAKRLENQARRNVGYAQNIHNPDNCVWTDKGEVVPPLIAAAATGVAAFVFGIREIGRAHV